MKITTIVCDFCGQNCGIHDSSDVKFALKLSCYRRISTSNTILKVHYPPISQTVHFCSPSCLQQYVKQWKQKGE